MPDRKRLLTWAGLAGLAGLSALVRLEGRRQWFWIDEGITAGIAGHPLRDLPGILARDGSPPLYYGIAHVWTRAFGDSEVALHSLSLVFALLAIPVVFWAGASLFGRRVAWVAAVLVALNPFLTYHGREARMYTLVALLALVAATCFVHAFAQGDRRYLAPFAIATVLLLYTHNTGLFFLCGVAAALVPCLYLRARERRVVVRDAAIAFGVVAVAYAPWAPTLLAQIRHTGAPWSRTPKLREAVSELSALLGDERVLVALLFAAGAGLVVAFRGGDRTRIATLGALAVVPLSVTWLTSQVEPNWATRYFAVIVGPVLLLAALGIVRAGWQGAAALALIVVFWTHPLGRVTDASPPLALDQKSNVRAVAAALGPELRRGDLIVATHPEQTPVLRYYLERFGPDGLVYATPLGVVTDPTYFDWRDVVERLRSTSPARDLTPSVAGLAPGAHVVLVGPSGPVARAAPEWFRLFHAKTDEWLRALDGMPRLRVAREIGARHAVLQGAAVFARVYAVA